MVTATNGSCHRHKAGRVVPEVVTGNMEAT